MGITKGTEIRPAQGKLGVLLPGLGAVATTFIAGVEAIRKGLAKPIGSLTQMGTIRLGKRTENRAPRVADLRIDGRPSVDSVYVKPGTEHMAALKTEEPDGDAPAFRWEIVPEVARAGYAGMGEQRSKPMPELIVKAGDGQLAFRAPEQEGAYRVFVFVTDGRGNGATANIPFFVRK